MMKVTYTQFQIDQLRKDKMIYMIEAVAVLLLCTFLFTALPAVPYVLPGMAGQEWFPSFMNNLVKFLLVFGIVYFLFAAIGNIFRFMKIRRLEAELKKEMERMMSDESCCGGGCGCGEHELADFEMATGSIDDDAVEGESVAETKVTTGSTNVLAEKMKTASKNKKKKARK